MVFWQQLATMLYYIADHLHLRPLQHLSDIFKDKIKQYMNSMFLSLMLRESENTGSPWPVPDQCNVDRKQLTLKIVSCVLIAEFASRSSVE